jgi:Ni,Fe-hydrogenase III component G
MKEFLPQAERLPGALPAWHASTRDLRPIAEKARAQKARLVALWASDESTSFALHVAFSLRAGLLWLTAPLEREQPRYPGIADLFPAASRMQRAAYDLLGVHAQGGADHRKWLRHGAWPAGQFPLRKDFEFSSEAAPPCACTPTRS